MSARARRWTVAVAVVLIAAVASAAAVAVIAQGNSHHRGSSGVAWMGAELRNWPGGGVLIEGVVAGGPAQVAGLLPGDLIVGIDNTSITTTADVTSALHQHAPGDLVGVHAQRGVSDFTARVNLAPRPAGMSVP